MKTASHTKRFKYAQLISFCCFVSLGDTVLSSYAFLCHKGIAHTAVQGWQAGGFDDLQAGVHRMNLPLAKLVAFGLTFETSHTARVWSEANTGGDVIHVLLNLERDVIHSWKAYERVPGAKWKVFEHRWEKRHRAQQRETYSAATFSVLVGPCVHQKYSVYNKSSTSATVASN